MRPSGLLRGLLLILFLRASAEPDDGDARRPAGRAVYETHCRVCHGDHGDGRGELAAATWPRPRSFREGWFKYRSTPFGALPTDDDLRRTIRRGVSGTAMGRFEALSEREVDDVIGYIKTFSGAWRDPARHSLPLPEPELPGWMDDPAQTARHARAGASLFLQHCAVCHGASGAGDGPGAAGLRDAWDQPSHPADLRRAHPASGDGVRDLYRTLTTGLNGTPMVSFAATLGDEQRWEVAVFVRGLRDTAAPAHP